jgi:D-ribose pyranose/furanose isomerase RbsD
MKYPTMDIMKLIDSVDESDFDQVVSIVVESIESIYTGAEVFHAKEQTKEELVTFIENLTTEQFAKVQEFFETMPKLKQEVDYTCPVCNKAHHKVLEGMQSFF